MVIHTPDGDLMSTFQDNFMGLDVTERQGIAHEAGLSLAYLHKHMYVHDGEPKFQFDNAVHLDAASSGLLPFWEITEGTVDWGFVRRRLNAAHRKGELS